MAPPFVQLIDLSIVRPLMQTFSRTSGLPMSIIDRGGKVLIASGWQRACAQFHRRFPLSLGRCLESDTDISTFYPQGRPPSSGDHFESRCRNGLVHIGFPIVVEGEHLATLFLSQFFFDPPDLDRFRRQAREYGMEEKPYMEAVLEVPVISHARVEEVLGFYSGFAKLLEKLATEHLRRLESRRALEASEHKFRSIFESALDSIVIVAADGRILEANTQTFVNLGYSREELLCLTKLDLHAPGERERIIQYVADVLRDGSARMETVQRRKDGSFLTVEISGRRVDFLGEPAVLCLTRDITARKAAEEKTKRALKEAQEAKAKIDAILKSVPDGLIVTDLRNRLVLMNETAKGILHPSSCDDPHIDALLPEQGLRDQIVATRENEEESPPFEWELEGGDGGGGRTVQAKSMPVRTAAGRVRGTITLLRDITREREIDRMKDDFISTAAHELRTPLSTIMGFVELLLSKGDYHFSADEEREFLRTVYERSEALARIIDDLLDLSRIRSGRLISLTKSPVDIVPLIAGMVASYREVSKRHSFKLDLPAPPVVLPADVGKIGQVMENLLSNAIKFSPSGGRIVVSGRHVGGDFQVTVSDEGIGMRPEQIGRMFEKFYRADASTTAASGLGLGMSIVKNIVEGHGGRIWVESEPGRGTRIHFTLPMI